MHVSVIIPVYNAEKFLPRCLDSLLAQRVAGMEIVLVNDGSDDASAAVCRAYAGQDRRIRIFDQDNRGAAAARNRGLDEARGDRIVFVDADDCVSRNFLPALCGVAVSTGADIVFTHVHRVRAGTILERTRYAEGTREKLADRLALLREVYYPGPVAKLYDASMLQKNALRFLSQEGYFGFAEDMLFALHTTYAARAVAFCPEAAYRYCLDNEHSLCSAPEKQARNNADRLIVIEHMLSFALEKGFGPEEFAPVLAAVENHLRWGGEGAVRTFMDRLPERGYPWDIQEHFRRYAAERERRTTRVRRVQERVKALLKERLWRFPRLYRLAARLYRRCH